LAGCQKNNKTTDAQVFTLTDELNHSGGADLGSLVISAQRTGMLQNVKCQAHSGVHEMLLTGGSVAFGFAGLLKK
jgi:predicted PhzF superfamily epimerase YddE/YHI9